MMTTLSYVAELKRPNVKKWTAPPLIIKGNSSSQLVTDKVVRFPDPLELGNLTTDKVTYRAVCGQNFYPILT